MTRTVARSTCFALAVVVINLIGVGQTQAEQRLTLSEDKPFAEAHIILQVSDAEKVHHDATMDIANNLMKHYEGQDKVDIEIIAFGAGISLLYREDNNNADRIASLIRHGVRFYACGNTLDTIERKTGKRPALIGSVETVQTGVAFMIDEVKRGYTLVHP